jgi:hypothetical protein
VKLGLLYACSVSRAVSTIPYHKFLRLNKRHCQHAKRAGYSHFHLQPSIYPLPLHSATQVISAANPLHKIVQSGGLCGHSTGSEESGRPIDFRLYALTPESTLTTSVDRSSTCAIRHISSDLITTALTNILLMTSSDIVYAASHQDVTAASGELPLHLHSMAQAICLHAVITHWSHLSPTTASSQE